MPDDHQMISPLSSLDEQRLQTQREVVERYLAEESNKKYASAAGKLGLLRMLIHNEVFQKDQTYELQCMGVILGDVFVQQMQMEWIMIEDSFGKDPAVRMPGTSVIIFPLTMISKRFERGEIVDVFDLFNGVAALIEDQIKTGRWK